MEIKLKLMIDNAAGKVLFAEAEKDFVDFLFGLLDLPLASILVLLGSGIHGSWGGVYDSLKNLDPNYLESTGIRDSLFTPRTATPGLRHSPFFTQFAGCNSRPSNQNNPTASHSFSVSPGGFGAPALNKPTASHLFSVSFDGLATSAPASSSERLGSIYTYPGIGESRPLSESSSPAPAEKEGFVKGAVRYMLGDDLRVEAMSAISSIALLSSLGVTDIRCLQEKTVTVDMPTGLKLLKAAFESTTVLTDVFLQPPPHTNSMSFN